MVCSGRPPAKPSPLASTMDQRTRRDRRQQIIYLPPRSPQLCRPATLACGESDFEKAYTHADVMEKALVFQVRPSQPRAVRNFSRLYLSSSSSSTTSLKCTPEPPSLPPKGYARIVRHLRLSIFTVYRRIFSLIFITNFVGLVLLLQRPIGDIKLDHLANYASTNILASILIRQDFIVNIIFRTAWLCPWSIPLRLRRWIARVYTYGGIHSGAAVAGTLWLLAFTSLLSIRFIQERIYTTPILITTWAILVLLITICMLTFPGLRSRHHNVFELTHRFLGWTAMLLFWIQLVLLAHHTSLTNHQTTMATLTHMPPFYILIATTIFIVLPWLRLRRWTFTIHPLSSHAVRLSFTYPLHRFSCLSLSTSPFGQYHPFATFPSPPPSPSTHPSPAASSPQLSTSLILSAAGDWTHNQIIHLTHLHSTVSPGSSPATASFFTKGSPHAGLLSLTLLFRRIIILTTGSGIGPSLSSLLERPATQKVRLIWSARAPERTFGPDLCEWVRRVEPGVRVLDTERGGRVDLVGVVWKEMLGLRGEWGQGESESEGGGSGGQKGWQSRGCRYGGHARKDGAANEDRGVEAVFVLSNKALTRKVVYALESRGIPAFGPIWDS